MVKYLSVIYQELVISEIQEQAEGFKTFAFAHGHGIHYLPGQYLTFIHKTTHGEIRRSYSIVSSPALHEPLAIGVKRVENGIFSRHLIDRARPGDVLLTTGAGGFFILPNNIDQYRQVFFFAAGSGITPVFSLIKNILHDQPSLQLVLVYSSSSASRTVFYNSLLQLEQQFQGRFYLRFLFSDSPQLKTARLNRELMVQLVNSYSIAPLSQCLFYICGPEAYMRLCTYTLQEEKVPKENIKRENFIIEKVRPHRASPPDHQTHTAILRQGNMEYHIPVDYPNTILQAAKKMGINLPYSCETGRCGNCAARCTSGKIWLSYNEVLTDKDLASGLTLTCVGHPVGGDVVVEI